ncbi:hypothetical protein OOK60_03900 [Trichothermofontia sichuanensis B231]|uniref:hypothetical protein n=1 Tax=Trichothermofontia sichuanensis TaxID=3045816 RepID=UPI002247E618|nr:hypothetical protein [Trichothermofontia sichuanensis]UZQ55229.1 hypothetical protein OOK60_03900 [Trichothermofontia sichuanensis B231]
MDEIQERTCSIFFYEGYLGVAPTVVTLIRTLENSGYRVIVFATQNSYPCVKILSHRVRILYLISGFNFPIISFFFKVIRKLGFESLALVLDFYLYFFQCLFKFIIQNQKSDSINIGIDTNGSIAALIKSRIFKQKMIYLSLELNEPSKYKNIANFLYRFENEALKLSELILIQDQDRFQVLSSYHNISNKQVIYLPNSLLINDKNNNCTLDHQNYFRNIFNLSEEDWPYLILHAGAIAQEFFSYEIAYAFSKLDQPYALIFHERKQRSHKESQILNIKKLNSKNMFLSLNPVDLSELYMIYSSAHIGLAFYRNDINENYSQIVKASGKLAEYLKYGKPVIVNDIPSLSKIVCQYGIGQIVKDPSSEVEFETAIATILADYDNYSKRALYCYQCEFDVSKNLQIFIHKLNSL